jgi:Rrf2 family protein
VRRSAKTEYASLAMLELARRHEADEPVRIREIAEAQGVPGRFLVQILLQLKAAGLVTSTRGASGGYRLAREPDAISLEDIRRVVEGPAEQTTALDARAGRSRATAVLLDAWQDVARQEEEALRSLDLATLATRTDASADAMYYI